LTLLRSQKARQAEDRLTIGSGYRDRGLVFARPDGEPLDPERVAKVFDRRVARCEVPAFGSTTSGIPMSLI
jgi:hypothetical protein